ncbi:mycothiol transferase [Tenggerimyces flavus]|uniref:DUF664 domain-containing protein n=1 Tax=Tenggerimyces flavus TaxID=1708749 RepID=A0ABV7YBE0_9ACTN|nr:DUF664 domain-containing protein [Tenggerimyces flavus]MBM7788974.1 putative damage-inducible protein DinB [Tenggerimyces flavus]
MTSAEILVDGFMRVQEEVHAAVEGLSLEELTFRVDEEANSISWVIWHLTRVQDDHVADAFGLEQVWLRDGWQERFGLPFSPDAHGYGQSSNDVAEVRADKDILTGYYDAVHAQTIQQVEKLTDADLPRVVDQNWTPPVTLAVRLVSVISDDLQHVGQAAFVRGVVLRRRG